MKRKIGLIIVITIVILLFVGNIYLGLKYTEKCNEAIDKAVEEFKFDYDEEILTKEVTQKEDYLIITIYGERTLVTYIYRDGEIWNYENESN